jgi:hypothetical protein
MKTRSITFFILVLSVLGMAQEKQVAPITAPFAGSTISDFKGKVEIQLPNHSLRAPTRGELLPAETQINTEEGRILLRLADGSDLLVRSNTRLVLKQPETNGWRYVQVMIGRVRAEIQKRLGTTPGFQIGTPSAVISVRGTSFDVEVNRAGLTEVDVREGVVQLDSTKGMGESVLIRAGFSSRVGFESGPESPRPTKEMRPDVDRPGRGGDDKHSDHDDDPIKRLQAATDDHHDGGSQHDGGGSSGGSGGSATSSSGGSGDSSKDSGSGDHGGHDHGGSGPPEF